jgi:hypothetical protein
MTTTELLIASIVGTIAFYIVMVFINQRVTGTPNEHKIKKGLRTLSIIYGILMAIQIISLINEIAKS